MTPGGITVSHACAVQMRVISGSACVFTRQELPAGGSGARLVGDTFSIVLSHQEWDRVMNAIRT
jgi:hypothetical protein